MNLIGENALALVPALYITGEILKGSRRVPDRYIPLILLLPGIAGAVALLGLSAASVIQGVLCAGAAVYGDQMAKQLFDR